MLDEIIARKREYVEQNKKRLPVSVLQERITRRPAPLDFAAALGGNRTRLIAEVKRASPSRGVLCPNFDPIGLAKTYARGGAAAISVLTESDYFLGSVDHLVAIREEVRLPLLRKDFIFDAYQIYEARAYGADALLLIVAVLDETQLAELLSISHSCGLTCLVEVHSEEEINVALHCDARIIGINNRDLSTFGVDIDTTRRLRPLIPRGCIVVSESGISQPQDIEKMKEWGVNAVLVGEALVTAADLPAKMKELIL